MLYRDFFFFFAEVCGPGFSRFKARREGHGLIIEEFSSMHEKSVCRSLFGGFCFFVYADAVDDM